MRPKTADERERRFIQYLVKCNKGAIREVQLTRLNRVANFRKELIELIEEFIDARAEERACAMLAEHAPEWLAGEVQIPIELPRQQPERRKKLPAWIPELERRVRRRRSISSE